MDQHQKLSSSGGVAANIKLKNVKGKAKVVEALARNPRIISITETFPGEKNSSLARMYIVYIDQNALSKTLSELQHNPAIEYAEIAPKRKLFISHH
ncbi:MAG TPA: hypothetical protein VI958_06745 [Acidobacteriota bacterium]